MYKTIARILPTVLVASWLALAVGCAETDSTPDGTAHAGGDEHDGEQMEAEEGPRGGRLLQAGDFTLEVTMFETGIPPEFRVYPMRDGKPLNPAEVQLTMELSRLGGAVDSITFAPQADFLRSTTSIT